MTTATFRTKDAAQTHKKHMENETGNSYRVKSVVVNKKQMFQVLKL